MKTGKKITSWWKENDLLVKSLGAAGALAGVIGVAAYSVTPPYPSAPAQQNCDAQAQQERPGTPVSNRTKPPALTP
jgi:hypothetical protein